MKALIGRECCCIFNLPGTEWPIEGYPAWVIVVDVDMPMICMKSKWAGRPIWVNASIIKTISDNDPVDVSWSASLPAKSWRGRAIKWLALRWNTEGDRK